MRNTQPALTVHIAQFAALLRDRQVVIAFHERALFDYLTLELHRRRRPARQHDAVGPAPLDHLESCSAAGSTGPAAPSPLRSGLLLKTYFIGDTSESSQGAPAGMFLATTRSPMMRSALERPPPRRFTTRPLAAPSFLRSPKLSMPPATSISSETHPIPEISGSSRSSKNYLRPLRQVLRVYSGFDKRASSAAANLSARRPNAGSCPRRAATGDPCR